MLALSDAFCIVMHTSALKTNGGNVDDRVGAVRGLDSVNRHLSVPGVARSKWAICKRGYSY